MSEMKAIGAIVSGATAVAGTGSITVATITSSAPGVLGILGFTTTTAVALPVAGIVAAAGLVSYGIYKGIQSAKSN